MEEKTVPYAQYIGINKPVNPGIQVLIDFLSFYFTIDSQRKNVNSFQWETIREKIYSMVICKEEQEQVREGLYQAVYEWIRSYATYSPVDGNNSREYLLPLTQGMLLYDRRVTDNLRNILNTLLYTTCEGEDQEIVFIEIQGLLYEVLYSPEARKGGYEELLDILSILFDGEKTDIKKEKLERERLVEIEWKPKKLAEEFRQDLEHILKSPYLKKENIFKRINELNILLNFYVIRYMISRSFENGENFILAKGSVNMPAEGRVHYAAFSNFASIREQIYKVSENYYYKIISNINPEGRKLILKKKEEDPSTKSHIVLKKGRDDIWLNVRETVLGINKYPSSNSDKSGANNVENMLFDYIGEDGKDNITNNQEIAHACMEISKRRASSVRKVSSVFSSQGKECYFAYPVGNVRQKYYVMSPQFTELMVHLFLCEQEDVCGTLGMLYQWLEEKYSIYLGYSSKLETYLKKNSIEQPSKSEFDDNQRAFIETLREINCIVKLSDNSYIITFDTEEGGWWK
ncbi:MAG: hypothetical protein HFG76_06230 [Hungatella sp.]|jgi:hypothetical protein|nr:hypothetical protein [Hungatella sp.]